IIFSRGKSKPNEPTLAPDIPVKKYAQGMQAVSSLSLALCLTGANLRAIPFYAQIMNITGFAGDGTDCSYRMPIPMVVILECGKMTQGKLNTLKEILLVAAPQTAISETYLYSVTRMGSITLPFDKAEQALDVVLQAAELAGYIGGKDFYLAINCAGQDTLDREKCFYDYVQNSAIKSFDEDVEFWVTLVRNYPSICMLIDPFRKQEGSLWRRLARQVSDNCLLIAEDCAEWPYKPKDLKDSKDIKMLETKETRDYQVKESKDSKEMKDIGDKDIEEIGSDTKLQDLFVCSGQVFRIQQNTTISDVIDYTSDYLVTGLQLLLATSHRVGDSWILADLGVALQIPFIKLGGMYRMERLTILNRMSIIEQKLIKDDKLKRNTELWRYPKLWSESLIDTQN
ncbi:enolase 4-like, partial [Argonauta hians]